MTKRTLVILSLIASLPGCTWMGRQADALGSHMPVIGERCEHWQCFTESGRAQSDMYKAQREKDEQPHQATAAPVDDVDSAPAPYPGK